MQFRTLLGKESRGLETRGLISLQEGLRDIQHERAEFVEKSISWRLIGYDFLHKRVGGSPLQKDLEKGAEALKKAFARKKPVYVIKSESNFSPISKDIVPPEPKSIIVQKIYQQTMQELEILLNKVSPKKLFHLGGGCAIGCPLFVI